MILDAESPPNTYSDDHILPICFRHTFAVSSESDGEPVKGSQQTITTTIAAQGTTLGKEREDPNSQLSSTHSHIDFEQITEVSGPSLPH